MNRASNRVALWWAPLFLSSTLLLPTMAAARTAELTELVPVGPPQFTSLLPTDLEECLRDPENPEGHLLRDSRWEAKCPLDEVFKRARRVQKKDPSLRLIMGDLIYWELDRLVSPFKERAAAAPEPQMKSAEIVDPTVVPTGPAQGLGDNPAAAAAGAGPSAPPELVNWTLFLRQHPEVEATANAATTPPPAAAKSLVKGKPLAGTRGDVKLPTETQTAVDKLLKEAQFWIEPLYTVDRTSIVNQEAAYRHLKIYAVAMRWDEVRKFVDHHASLMFSRKSLEDRIVRDISNWYEKSQSSLLAEWLVVKLRELRPQEITGTRANDLFYWLRSLELGSVPEEGRQKQNLLETLRKLSIAYPSDDDQRRINDVLKKVGLEEEFKPVTMREMSFQELMLHARSQVREVDTLGALRTMRRIRRIEDNLTQDQLWEALEYHIKVLRILDERPQIPTILKYYVSKGGFLEPPKKTGDLAKFMSRAHELAKYNWSYDDPAKAQVILDQILELNKKYKTEYNMGAALLVKARIKEQAKDIVAAIPLMDEAMKYRLPEDMRNDLMWRKIFSRLDEAEVGNKDYKSVLPLFEPLRKVVQKDAGDWGRFSYWYGRVLLMSGDKDQAKEYFEKAYDSDSYSFYSNLGGLELIRMGDKPKKWKPIERDDAVLFEDRRWSTPNWALYFKDTGEPLNAQFRDLARVYFLARAGRYDEARDAFGDLDRALWQRLFKKSIPWAQRRDFMRAVAYTRIALKDPMGSLKAAEIARQANGKDFEQADLLSLYPLPYWADIQNEAQKVKLNPWLVASLIRQESAFNPRARSWANALGLMQMIPPVAKEEAKLMKLDKFENEDLYQTTMALSLGTHHLSRLIERFGGSYICSVASYNAGWPPVEKWLNFYPNNVSLTFIERIPYRETQNYVKSILRNFMNYQRIYKNGDFDTDLITKMPQASTQPPAAVAKPADAPKS